MLGDAGPGASPRRRAAVALGIGLLLPFSLAAGLLALTIPQPDPLPVPVAGVAAPVATVAVAGSGTWAVVPPVPRQALEASMPLPPPDAPEPMAGSVVTLPAPPAPILRALHQASRSTGTDPALLLALAWRESGFDRLADNRQSSALGLMQFTEETWLETVRDFGPRHGLARQAQAIQTDRRSGQISVRDARSRRYLLGLRTDAKLSATLAAARLHAERPALEAALGREVTAVDLYAVHFLGRTGARRFLTEHQRAPGQAVVRVVSADGLARNRNVFITADGRSRRLGEVHAAFAAAIEDQRSGNGRRMASLAPNGPNPG